ncbi:DUF5683 domain-containing protein [Patiriisocius marinus]|uniref:DUF5683 domain-containing protein n=1 Tax=Patiriisocius marinus TaxID=1397112 RepID=A0A5J4INL1_9FLAO|nr:DUF5683 domain-containing protein [Patiriisocius marinus]GER59009.1 hypothetical protein ULMA_11170 [Patiriisocius marinus]
MVKNNLLYIVFLITISLFAQKDSLVINREIKVVIKDTIKANAYDPLAPSRAAFYSAALPGLGQAYNKKYWKIPVIYAGMAAGVYFYIKNDKEYTRFRNAYKRRLAGFTDDEFFGDGTTALISNDRLIDAQKTSQTNKDVSIIVSLAFYLLNVIDANVDAHLRQYDVDDNLSLSPQFNLDEINSQAQYGLSFKYIIK